MKLKALTIWLGLSLAYQAQAQTQIGSNDQPNTFKAGKIAPADWETFKQTTTLFTLQFKDYDEAENYEKAIRSVWKITPIKIIRPNEIGNYLDHEGYSFFTFGGFMVTSNPNAMSNVSHLHVTYELWMPVLKKGKLSKQKMLARQFLYPNNQTLFTALKNKRDFSGAMSQHMYNDAEIYTWGPGILKGFLHTIQDGLSAKEERSIFKEIEDKAALASLRTDTLFVPKYVYTKFNMLTGSEKDDDDDADEQLSKAYPYPVKIVSNEELNERILDKSRPIKYLVYLKSNTDKFINVFDSKEGQLIYSRYVKLSYNFKNKDLGKLAKAIP